MPSAGVTLTGVAAVGRNDAWAVGRRVAGHASGPLLMHWDGARWSDVRLPRFPGSTLTADSDFPKADLESISAAGPRNVWATGVIYPGGDSRPFLLHWNGHIWRTQPVRWAQPATGTGMIVASGSSGAWFVWNSLIEYWNGVRWKAIASPFGARVGVASFSATGWKDAWAVGSYGSPAKGPTTSAHPLAAHWDGSSWNITPVPDPPASTYSGLDNVVALSPGGAWAVGHGTTPRGYQDFVVRWDGARWTTTAVPNPADIGWGPPSLAAARDGSAWVVTGCANGDNAVLGWDGARWSVVPHPRDLHWAPWTSAEFRKSGLPSCG